MKIAYFGSPIFSATLLEQLILDKSLGLEISLVVTQPDKPIGRKRVLTPSSVKEVAKKYNIPVWSKQLNDSNGDIDIFAHWGTKGVPSGDKNGNIGMRAILEQIDLAIVFAYGFKQLIPLDLLRAPKIQFEIGEGKTSGFINIHPSLLPRFRGSSPIAYPILLGENKTGVTLFVMDEKMDHGPIITQEEIEIRLNDVRSDMEKKLTQQGFEMIKKFLISTDLNRFQPIQQNHHLATHAPFMTKDDGFIPFTVLQKALKNEPLTVQELPHIVRNYKKKFPVSLRQNSGIFNPLGTMSDPIGNKNDTVEAFTNTATILYNFWRGMNPWPGLWTKVIINGEEKRLKILSFQFITNPQSPISSPLSISSVQLEGKKEVDFPTFQKAYGIFS